MRPISHTRQDEPRNTCSYTMTCLPVRGDTPSALTSGLSYVVDKHFITIFTTYISVDPAHHEIVRAKFGKGGTKNNKGHKIIRKASNATS